MLTPCTYRGHEAVALSLPTGDRAVIALQGAQVLSWTTPLTGPGSEGVEQLYLSPRAVADGRTAIRGGVPVCFPQFNQRVLGDKPLPKHGLARNQRWTPVDATAEGADAIAQLTWQDDEATRAVWSARFDAQLAVRLSPGALAVGFRVRNVGAHAWPFAVALHTYLRVDDVTRATLQGLDGVRYWDAVADLARPQRRRTQRGAVKFGTETDRVYESGARHLELVDGARRLELAQSTSMPETVVWNPAAALCAQLADMPADGWRHMVCVEAACIDAPVLLAPGQEWLGWQKLAVAARR